MQLKLWCETCRTWIDEVDTVEILDRVTWLCCSACGEGIVRVEL